MNIETLKKRTDNKLTWDKGPWHFEPDHLRWVDDKTGLACLIKRGPSGALCGYVGVTEGHPAFGLSGYKSDFDIDEVLSGEATKKAPIQKQMNDIRVHGGITFSGKWEEESKDIYWLGFDCAHAGDFCPKYGEKDDPILGLGKPTGWGSTQEYRDLEYTKNQCRELAEQLSKIK